VHKTIWPCATAGNGPEPFTDIRQRLCPSVRSSAIPTPRLALLAQPVTAFDGALRDMARDLPETMHAAPGIGITAPHIGVSLRVVVLDLDANDGAQTYVNPEIIWASPEMIMHREGSVSMPGGNDDIRRHARVRINYRDIHGNAQTGAITSRAKGVAERSLLAN
jgi:peptide deformylase